MAFDITKKEDREACKNILDLVANAKEKTSLGQEIQQMQGLLKEYDEAKGFFNILKRRDIKKQFDSLQIKVENASSGKQYVADSKPKDIKGEQYSSAGLKQAQAAQYGAAEFKRTHEYASTASVSSRSSDSGIYAGFPQGQGENSPKTTPRQQHQKLPDAPPPPGTTFKPQTPVAPPTPGIMYGALPAEPPAAPPRQKIYTTLPPEQADRTNYQPLGKLVQGSMTQKLADQAAKQAQQNKDVKGR